MKNILNSILAGMLITLASCSDGYIDDITPVPQGTDNAAPTVQIISPTSDLAFPSKVSSNDTNFSFKVTDDIEIGSVSIYLDGKLLNTYNSFIDYRIFNGNYAYKSLSLGSHTLKIDAIDKAGKTNTQSFTFGVTKYTPILDSETLYVPFNSGNDFTDLVNLTTASIIGTPTTGSGKKGLAYQGATDAYFTFPLTGMYSTNGISFTFWYKVNASPDRSGIITINDDNDNTNDNRTKGLRLFREGSASSQTIKLNVGTGAGESWNDGGNLTVDGKWVHVAVTVSSTDSKIYFDGVLQRTATFTSFDFSSSSTITIGSGAPSFTYWGHKSDLSLIDELRIYDKALTETEVKNTMK